MIRIVMICFWVGRTIMVETENEAKVGLVLERPKSPIIATKKAILLFQRKIKRNSFGRPKP